MPKSIGYKIFTIFLFACVRGKMIKTSKADLMKCTLKYILELVACDIHHTDKYWIIVGQKVTFLTVYTMFLEKYLFVYLRDQAIFIGAWGRCKCKLSYEKKKKMPHGKKKKKKKMPHGKKKTKKNKTNKKKNKQKKKKKTMKKSIRPMADSKKKSPSPMTLYHFPPYYETKYFILQ